MKNSFSRTSSVTWEIVLITVAALIVYGNSFSHPFVYDDAQAIENNPTIRHLWPIGEPLSPPAGFTVGGRPLLNLSFALNYALSGTAVWSYHAVNLLIHIVTGLALFGIVRRTLLLPIMQERFGNDANALALVVALIWTVHPVQTEAVSFISQRAESLAGLFYLLTIYGLIRSTELPENGRLWSACSVTTCLLGMATKEVMVTAPLIALLYDRTFIAGTFREAWHRRWRLYLGLAASWLLLGYLAADSGQRGMGSGGGVTPWIYALTECRVVVHYLTLTVWPYPLVFDYGTPLEGDPMKVIPQALLLIALLTLVVIALVRWPIVGFLGAWFFFILAPTSSIFPLPFEPMAERRLYLPLASVVVLVVLGLYALLGKNSRYAWGVLVIVCGMLTFERNEDYRSSLVLWADTVAKSPDNERAHYNYGVVLLNAGQIAEAQEQFQETLQINPTYADAYNNLGTIFLRDGQRVEAIGMFANALRLNPTLADAQNNWANALLGLGRVAEAVDHYREALLLDPHNPTIQDNLNRALSLSR